MKKNILFFLCLSLVFILCSCSSPKQEELIETVNPYIENQEVQEQKMSVAMITDSSDITDESFNQTTYEACRDYCGENRIGFMYYKPEENTNEARVAMVENAIEDGYNILVMSGYHFADAVCKCAPKNPEIRFVVIDVTKEDYLEAEISNELEENTTFSNVYTVVFKEEICGYMAGYAAVKLGYDKLGFLGGEPVPSVVRYGYGFIQGADAAAKELGSNHCELKYAYCNQFIGNDNITSTMEKWYSEGTQVIFSSGGSIYTSVAQAAAKTNGKVIGVDVDQSKIIDRYGEKMTVTSAMKGIYESIRDALINIFEENKWEELAGKTDNLGLISDSNPENNYVQIPMETTQWSDGFTKDDYLELVSRIYNGEIMVSDDISLDVSQVANGIKVKEIMME